MPKNPASNSSAREMKPPHRVFILERAAGSGSNQSSTANRLAGISEMLQTPCLKFSQNSSGLDAPGNRHATPTIATGACSGKAGERFSRIRWSKRSRSREVRFAIEDVIKG